MDQRTMKPTFIIEYCTNCSSHSWNTRHNEAKYLQMAQQVETAIKAALPKADINCRAGHFSFDLLDPMQITGTQQQYQPTDHMFAIAERNLHLRPMPSANPSEPTRFVKLDKMAIGGLEVYFNGIRLFSKIQSGLWPHAELLA